jgi:hypothetical protein
MSKEVSSRNPEPVRTIDDLVAALRKNPPSILEGATRPVLDRREFGSDPFFTLEAMRETFEILIPFSTSSFRRSTQTHFGKNYRISEKILTHDGVALAKRIAYIGEDIGKQGPLDGTFYPEQTIGLYGLASEEDSFMPIGIELTQYRNNSSKEKVNVYKKIMQIRVQISIGAPAWDRDYNQLLNPYFHLHLFREPNE